MPVSLEIGDKVLIELPPEAAGEYHQVRLTGTTGSTFTGALVRPTLAVL